MKMPKMARAIRDQKQAAFIQQQLEAMKAEYPNKLMSALGKAAVRGIETELHNGVYRFYINRMAYDVEPNFTETSYRELVNFLSTIEEIELNERNRAEAANRYAEIKRKIQSVLTEEELQILENGPPSEEESSWYSSY